MELVIKMSEADFDLLKSLTQLHKPNFWERAVLNGTVLPEHHGRLIDADAFLAWLIFKGYIDNAKCGEVAEAIRKTTIIPATKGGE